MGHSNSDSFKIRPAEVADAGLILGFIRDLADYEKAPQSVITDESQLKASLFDSQSPAQALICLQDEVPIGYAVFFFSYSTWLGRKGLYLEDLYISPDYRHCGAGKKVLCYLAKQAVANGCGRFEWSVLDWNEPAIRFYEKLGAKAQSEWTQYRLSGDALLQLAEEL